MEMTVPEAARRAGRNPETIRRWIWSGRLPSRKVGNQHLVESDAVDALIGAVVIGDEELPEVEIGGEWGAWLRDARAFQEHLRARGIRLPSGAEMVRESRRGH